ncbi:hypothetical protein SAMN02910298_01955 [Pseudobutyrivibrio sp. YE44]|uniref:DUF4176 domain-containing protein n=1 Tax=Pseudobutyrivibrio sp. YE44 TaxID=1520802 RepID=UPI00087EE453|nr:DUF4176 domain-containing protein [Pseudobutyrivibrio sp. YE44]SDB40061.1 hypothetical protein SAMN02910298_01955 [Pseudobutyrivibrio sp. YE44]
MENKKWLPLGSVVILDGGIQKLMIVSRGMVIPIRGKEYMFEYGGCVYPQGLVSDRVFYFNEEDIQEVVFKGFADVDDERMEKNLNKWIAEKNIERGKVKLLKGKEQ